MDKKTPSKPFYKHPAGSKVFRIILAIIPIIWVIRKINIAELDEAIAQVAWWTIPIVILNVLLSMYLQGVRWWLILRGHIKDLPFGVALKYHFLGIFYSIVLPGNMAQDFVKAAIVSRKCSYSHVWGATWLYKLISLFSMVALSCYGLFYLDEKVIQSLFFSPFIIIGFTFFIIILLILSFSKRTTRPFRSFFLAILPKKIINITDGIRQGIYDYREKPFLLAMGTFMGIGIQALVVFNSALLIKGISGSFFISACFAFIPIIEIVCTVIPITPSGIGLREGLVAFMFTFLGLSNEELGIYIAVSMVSYLLKLVGGIPLLFPEKGKSDYSTVSST